MIITIAREGSISLGFWHHPGTTLFVNAFINFTVQNILFIYQYI